LRTVSVRDILRRVLTSTARLLRLLSLLQGRREWSGGDLCLALGVDVRTIRRDVDRLRQLGYVVDASAGPGGGYRLSAGSETPPLLLDDEEAVAVAVALGAAAGDVTGTQDVALRVLAKLDQLLPRRLRRKLTAIPTVTLSLMRPESTVNLKMLSAIAAACRDHLTLRFSYKDTAGRGTRRLVEPMRLVHTGRRWYLAAWDIERGDWRTFRVDRIDAQSRPVQGARFVPRQPPEDFATYVSRSISSSRYRHQARLLVNVPAATLRASVSPWMGVVEEHDGTSCVLTVGGDSLTGIAGMLVFIDVEFTVLDPPELSAALHDVASRLTRATTTRSHARE
jgi:predicted DNA-binding transcriptional regulator YafY